jgi:hypothetical protein
VSSSNKQQAADSKADAAKVKAAEEAAKAKAAKDKTAKADEDGESNGKGKTRIIARGNVGVVKENATRRWKEPAA